VAQCPGEVLPLTELALALSVLIAAHLGPSAPGIRERLIATLGRPAFFSLHGLISAALVVWIIRLYTGVGTVWLWSPPGWLRLFAVFAMPVALWLVAARAMERPGDVPLGIYRVSVVPGSAGVLIWTVLHLLNIGHVAGILVFAAFTTIAAVSLVKNWRLAPPACRRVGPVPFLAAVAGRQPFSVGDLAAGPVLVALGAWLALLALHPVVIGVDPASGLVW
jgi:uncharacterized membrane protein